MTGNAAAGAPDREEVAARVRALLAEALHRDVAEIGLDDRLREDLGAEEFDFQWAEGRTYSYDRLLAVEDVSDEVLGAVDRARTDDERREARARAAREIETRLRTRHGADVTMIVRSRNSSRRSEQPWRSIARRRMPSKTKRTGHHSVSPSTRAVSRG